MGARTPGTRLLRRCEAVGWTHRRTSKGHVLVTTDRGETFTFSPEANRRGYANALATARRLGLEESERRLAEADGRRHAAVLEADRRRGAGNGRLPATADPGTTDTDPPAERGMYTETVQVTPDWAARHLAIDLPLLDGQPMRQRRLHDRHVETFEAIINRGEWFLSPQGIALSAEGAVLDGQHRLWAVVATGATVPMRVTYNVAPQTFPNLDTGKGRTSADALSILGEANTTHLASAGKLLGCYLRWQADPAGTPHWSNWNRIKLSNTQMLNLIAAHPQLRDAVAHAVSVAPRLRVTTAALATFRHLALRAWPGPEGTQRFDGFWDALTRGQMLAEGDPAYTLREWFPAPARPRHRHAGQIRTPPRSAAAGPAERLGQARAG